MKPLNCMLKGRTIAFLENVGTNLDDSIRAHRQEESIKGRMVQSTKRYPVTHDRLPLRFCIRHDVGGVKQLTMPQTTESTLIPVCEEDTFAERSLMQSAPSQ